MLCACAPLRWLFLGRRRNTCACFALAARRAGDSRPGPREMALHEREGALLRGKAVLPCASSGPRFVGWLARVSRLRATALAIFWGGGAVHALVSRLRRVALATIAPEPTKWPCKSEKPPFFGARPCSHVPALQAIGAAYFPAGLFFVSYWLSPANTLHRAPVGQGLLPPRPARAFGFWSFRALAKARRGRVYV